MMIEHLNYINKFFIIPAIFFTCLVIPFINRRKPIYNHFTDTTKIITENSKYINDIEIDNSNNSNNDSDNNHESVLNQTLPIQSSFPSEAEDQSQSIEYPDKKDSDYFINYDGGELEPEWQWIKNISIVYSWVNGNDINFLDVKSKFNGGLRQYNSRDQSADEIRYSLRSITKYLPWHEGKIYILANDQVPSWFEVNNPKVEIIFHRDIFPDHVYPTYDSNTIELYLDKIPGITERFIYLNDDFFINRYLHPSFLFSGKDFYLKPYKSSKVRKFQEDSVKKILEINDVHDIYVVQSYYTYLTAKKYFDDNFEYHYLMHFPYIFYRDLFEPYRQLLSEEFKMMISDRFRNSYKIQVIYLYYVFLEYGTKHEDFPMKLGGQGLAQNFTGYTLPENRTIKSYSVVPCQTPKDNHRILFGEVTNNPKRNENLFNRINKRKKDLFTYTINDNYSKVESLYQFTEFMINKYPEPNIFEKKDYIELENNYLSDYHKAELYYKNRNKKDGKKQKQNQKEKEEEEEETDPEAAEYSKFKNFNDYKMNLIKTYLEDKKALAGPTKLISDRESDEIQFLLSYQGEELEKEWNWVKNISLVYLWENENFQNFNSTILLEELKYSLRSVESNLPWFNGNIYIITQNESSPELDWIKTTTDDHRDGKDSDDKEGKEKDERDSDDNNDKDNKESDGKENGKRDSDDNNDKDKDSDDNKNDGNHEDDKKDSKIYIIHQNKILPKEYYDTKNKYILQMYLDRIPGLSEKFIYLNPHHYFIKPVHPRFFFNKDFYPIYNLEEPMSSDEVEIEKKDDHYQSFFTTYSLLHDYFNDNYITTYRHFMDAPYSFYRDLFEPVRSLFNSTFNEMIDSVQSSDSTDGNRSNHEILPFYLISNYNIYGTAQPHYPNYVAGYGKIREAELPQLNPNRTVDYYGFDITTKAISNSTMILEMDREEETTEFLKEIKTTDKLFISWDVNEQEDLSSETLNDFKEYMNILFEKKSSFES